MRLVDGRLSLQRKSLEPNDGKGFWTEYQTPDPGVPYKVRTYHQGKVLWEETIQGENRYRYRAGGHVGLCREADAEGRHLLETPGPDGPLGITVHGRASRTNLANLERALLDMPPTARPHLLNIFICSEIGVQTDLDGKNPIKVAGLGSTNMVIVDRDQLNSLEATKAVLYHESGHSLDQSHKPALSQRKPWGAAPQLEGYGAKNSLEEFAEVHRMVLLEWRTLTRYTTKDWAAEPLGAKKRQIFDLYNTAAPVLTGTKQGLLVGQSGL